MEDSLSVNRVPISSRRATGAVDLDEVACRCSGVEKDTVTSFWCRLRFGRSGNGGNSCVFVECDRGRWNWGRARECEFRRGGDVDVE